MFYINAATTLRSKRFAARLPRLGKDSRKVNSRHPQICRQSSDGYCICQHKSLHGGVNDLLNVPVLLARLFYLLGRSIYNCFFQWKVFNTDPLKQYSRWVGCNINLFETVRAYGAIAIESYRLSGVRDS